MEVTSVKIQKIFDDPKQMLVGIASVIIDGMLCINDIRILRSSEKIFVAMPNRMIEDGLYKDVVHPINREGRAILEESILSTYAAYVEERNSDSKEAPEEPKA